MKRNNKNKEIKKREDLPELNAGFLANNLWVLIASILVIKSISDNSSLMRIFSLIFST